MNLAFITKRYDTMGGTERDLFELAGRLAQYGHAVHVYCWESRVDAQPGVTLHRLPFPRTNRTLQVRSLARYGPSAAEQGGHELVISYAKVLRQDVARCEGGTHRGFLEQVREVEGPLQYVARRLSPFHRAMLAVERRQYHPDHYARIVAISGRVKEEIQHYLGVPESDIDVIYSGVDEQAYHPDRRSRLRPAARSELGLSDEARVILFVGNGFRRKGLDTLLRAIGRLRELDPRCLVVGTDRRLAGYRRFARRLGIGEKVIFAGSQAETRRFYAAADLFVLPSLHEAFGKVVLEALASGLPAVVSARAGAAEILTGRLASYRLDDPLDDAQLAALLIRGLDARERDALGREARAIALHYTLDKHARAMEASFGETLARKRRDRGPDARDVSRA